jgi:hypothetical protein
VNAVQRVNLDELNGWRAVAGQTVYQRLYEWDKNWNFLQVLDDSGRLISINTMTVTGNNPFPWPVGLTTVTSDANGAIRALQNGNWRAECDVDYEGRLTEIRWASRECEWRGSIGRRTAGGEARSV